MPTEAIVSVTNRCDARCTMCNIWQLDREEFLRAEDYRRAIPNSLRNVNITGGEALLRPDIAEITQAIHESSHGARIIIATNGFRTDRTVSTIAAIRKHVPSLGVAVSIDGIASTHDRMRGVPKAHERAMETLQALRADGVEDLRIGFTATPDNITELEQVYDLSMSLNVEFAATIAQNSDVYYSTQTNRQIDVAAVEHHFGALIGKRLSSLVPKNWLRAYFDNGVIHFAKTGERLTMCDSTSGFFYLAPTGAVYPCLTLSTILGNVRTQSFDEIWYGVEAARMRAEVARCRKCWMVCTARNQLKHQPIAVGSWILGRQTKSLMGRGLRSIGIAPWTAP